MFDDNERIEEEVTLEGTIEEITEKAYGFDFGTGKKFKKLVYLPMSHVDIEEEDWERGDSVQVTVPLWLAENEGLV